MEWLVLVDLEGALNLSLSLVPDLEAAEGIQVKFEEAPSVLNFHACLSLGEEGVGRRPLQWRWGGTSSCAW